MNVVMDGTSMADSWNGIPDYSRKHADHRFTTLDVVKS